MAAIFSETPGIDAHDIVRGENVKILLVWLLSFAPLFTAKWY
jgi:hypothetical protein